MIITNKKRYIVLDTETTGINRMGFPHENHRIIEIGAVEIINRRFTGNNFHVYLQPNRLIELNAFKIHGITDDFLSNKPIFKDIAESFLKYIQNTTLIIHNASFDIGFIDQEFNMLNMNIKNISHYCAIIDTLKIARSLFPGKKNTLDALCSRYRINTSHRSVHSALIDSTLLGKVYLLMTGGQESLFSSNTSNNSFDNLEKIVRKKNTTLKVLKANKQEVKLHQDYLKYIQKKNNTSIL